MKDFVEIKNARIHNLKGIDVKIPKNKLTIITGVSGSGKSSLAFDTLYEEGKKRYLMFSGAMFVVDKENVTDEITGLSPTVAVEQRIIRQSNPRSTVGTRTKVGTLIAALFANFGVLDQGYENMLPLNVAMFQKNSPQGMCPKCLGKGEYYQLDEDKLLEGKRDKPICDLLNGICDNGLYHRMMVKYERSTGFTSKKTFNELTEEEYNYLMYGYGLHYQGVVKNLVNIYSVMTQRSQSWVTKLDNVISYIKCKKCEGTGLSAVIAHTRIGGKTITELENMYISDLLLFFKNLDCEKTPLHKKIESKLECLCEVGLKHLALSRSIPTLSGGEIQRLFLATYILADMDSIIFIFDEPTIGLHEQEKAQLISIIKRLIKVGNTVVCVEHDENFMREADYIIDIGPGAGVLGGLKIYEGGYEEFLHCTNSKTSPYLLNNGFRIKRTYRQGNGKSMDIIGAKTHNLRDVNVTIPLGMMVGVAGVSGSGKSSLISDTLVPLLKDSMHGNCVSDDIETGNDNISDDISEDDENIDDTVIDTDSKDTGYASILGVENIKKCYVIDQRPIGRSKTSCPATYTGIMDHVRTIYASCEEAKAKGFKTGMFSRNSKGKCPYCKGVGFIHYHVGFGNHINIKCEKCNGYGFRPEVMEIKIDDCTINDVLDMSVDEAIVFFKDKDKVVYDMLLILHHVGMGYIKLGQSTPTISGGESQRIKLAKELSKGKYGKNCLYIMDEPTTGLSFSDSERLMSIMNELVDKGNSIIVTEHDPYILSNCDYIIEMGVGGGLEGGNLIARGTPEQLKNNKSSIIGRYLK